MTVTDADVDDLLDGAKDEYWRSPVDNRIGGIRAVIRYVLEQRAATKPETMEEVNRVIQQGVDAWYASRDDESQHYIARAIIDRYGAPPPRTLTEVRDAAPADLPVGTIRCGDGLTAAQEAMSAEAKNIQARYATDAAVRLDGIAFQNTAEGTEFWERIRQRILSMAGAFRASAAPKPKTVEQAAAI